MASQAPTPMTCQPTETSITVWWQAHPGASGYKLQFREFPKPWKEALEIETPDERLVVQGLTPTTTYEFRLVAVVAGADVGPGVAVACDTLVVGCTPKNEEKKGKCAIV